MYTITIRRFNSLIALLSITLTWVVGAQASQTHTGTITSLASHPATADSNLAESWTALQLSGFASSPACGGADDGAGDLAYIGFPDIEKSLTSLSLSAYLNGQTVVAEVDDQNLLSGFCRLKRLVLVDAVANSSSSPEILSFSHEDLIAAYTMDNISGSTLEDESVNNNDGLLVNSPAVLVGKFGSAYESNGSNSYISGFDLGVAQAPFSVSLWFKDPGLANDKVILGWFDGSTTKRFYIGFPNSGNELGLGLDSSSYVSDTFAFTRDNDWHHVVMNVGAGQTELFVDGASLGVKVGAVSGTKTFFFGAVNHTGSSSNQMQVQMDQLRIFNRHLSQSEIDSLYSE